MSQFDRITVYNVILEDGLIPIFYNKDVTTVKKITKALVKGGSRVLEFTNRGDLAIEVFSDLIKFSMKEYPDLIVGVGTVIDASTAALYLANGANFIVGPSFDKETALLCNKRKVAYIPGAATATEISIAEEFGAEIVKIFRGSTAGGPEFIKAVLGPMPWSKLMPTGGVTTEEDNIKAWFNSGVACIGVGSKLISNKLISEGKYDEITNLTSKVLKLIKSIRKF